MAGWVKISRSINEHWIWKDPDKLKWWLDILLTVNYRDTKVNIGYKLIDCGRGESLLSLKSWGERWGVSKTVVNNFFNLLKNDGMILLINETVTTRLIVCNYDSYQIEENDTELPKKRNRTATEPQQNRNSATIEEIKKDKKEKNNISIDPQLVLNMYHSFCPLLPKVVKLNKSRVQKIGARYTEMNNDSVILENLFRKVGESKFLNGENNNGWKASFDWIFENDKNWLKIIEGNYDNKGNNNSTPTDRELIGSIALGLQLRE